MEHREKFNIGNYFLSLVFDLLFFYGCLVILSAMGGFLSRLFFSPLSEIGIFGVVLFISLTFWLIYFFIIFKRTGQTMGMKLFRVKITSRNGESLSYSTVLLWSIAIPILATPLIECLAIFPAPHETLIERLSNSKIILIS